MHVIRLSLRHIRQTFFKSLCLFLISLILVLSVNITAHLRERQTEDLSYVYRDFIVTATVSDLTGSKTDGLFISSIYISFFDDERFRLAELLKELCLKRGVTLLQADNIILSDINASGNLVGGTRLAAFDALSPEKGVSVSFAEGYDESFFLANKTDCLVSSTLLEVLGKSAGDTVALTVIDSLRTNTNDDIFEKERKPEEVTADFKIIGSFLGGNAYQIYCPWEVVCDLGRESTKQPLFSEIMSATISDNYRIGELRENAALYFAKPGVISGDSDYKLGILINDEVFNTTVKELKQSIQFNNQMIPMLFFFSAAVGFFLSFLLVRTRKTEFAVMRSVGITRTKLFFTVFIEQLLLCAGGVGLGMAASALLWGDIMARESAIIAVCFSAGTAFSVFMSTVVNVMAAMKIKE